MHNKYNVLESWDHPCPYPMHGKTVFHETGPWCQKDWALLPKLNFIPVLVCLGCYNKTPHAGGLSNRNSFFYCLGGWKSLIRCWQVCFLLGPLCPWSADGHLLIVSSHGLSSGDVHSCCFVCVHISSSWGHSSHGPWSHPQDLIYPHLPL